jgi:hypothetical protein
MDTPVGRFIVETAVGLGRTPAQVEPVVKKLVEEEWFDTIESLNAISDDHWARLGVPSRLVDALKTRLNEQVPELKPIIPPSSSSNVVIMAEIAPADMNDSMLAIPASVLVESVRQEIKETVCYDESLADDAWKDTLRESLRILDTIVGNVLKDTSNIKYRQIRATNSKFQKHIGRWSSAMNLLKALGFKVDNTDTWVCTTMYVSRFTDVKTELERSLTELGVVVESTAFNPFKASIINAGDTFGVPSSRTIAEREAEISKLREEAALLQRAGSGALGSPVERPRFLCLGAAVRRNTFLDMEEETEEDRTLLLSNLRSIAAAGESSQKFKSREKIELERIRARQVYSSTKVRIVFSDKTALELIVLPKETVGGLYRIVDECLKEKYRNSAEWTLTISPPMRKLSRKSKTTMIEEGFVPSVIMRMMMDGQQCAGNIVVRDEYL